MPSPDLRASPEIPHTLSKGLTLPRGRSDVSTDFPGKAPGEVDGLRDNPPGFPEHADRTAMELITVDPVASKDLDQAVRIERNGSGYRVHYAIADITAWVRPGSALEVEAIRRGETLYAPGAKVPLYPNPFSEGIGLLLADGRPYPAVSRTHDLDAGGVSARVGIERTPVYSHAKLSCGEVQADADASRAYPSVALLSIVDELRQRLETECGGASLDLPGREIAAENGTWLTRFRSSLPVERHNAQVSLLASTVATELMVGAAIRILGTLSATSPGATDRLHLSTGALGIDQPVAQSYPDFVRGLEPGEPAELAVLVRCTSLFRGASYRSFDGSLPSDGLGHSTPTARYSHITTPLRQLVDRFTSEICVSIGQGEPVPERVRENLAGLPELMTASSRRARSWEHSVMDLAEVLVLQKRVGEVFDVVPVDVNPRSGMRTFQIADPAAEAKLPTEDHGPGRAIRMWLDGVDLSEGGTVFFHAV